jgi:hypothetical protein
MSRQTNNVVNGRQVLGAAAPIVGRAMAPQVANAANGARLNYESARVAPSAYVQASAQYTQQMAMPAPQYQMAEAAEFSECQIPQPIQIRVPQVTIRKHSFPIVFSTYDRVVSHETIEVPVQYQKVDNPIVQHSMCAPAAAMAMSEAASPAIYGSCSKSSFSPTMVDATNSMYGGAVAAEQYAMKAAYNNNNYRQQNSYSNML